jgi:adenylosuccinate synthase
MPCTVIVGGAFGDEGKGKIISYLSIKRNPKIAVRGGVGPNAGHTVVVKDRTLKLRMLPSAVVNANVQLMIGAGVLVNPDVFLKEVEETGSQARTTIDNNCAVIEERHISLDKEGHLKERIGTTGTGTGPANADRIMRIARVAREDPKLKNYVGNVATAVNESLDSGELVLVEGTQGTMLSLYFGTYPYVTSKDVTASGVCSDVGIGPKRVDEIIVVFKAYLTRVGAGPLAGELDGEETKRRGWDEYGSVTGRLRRAAPFDYELAMRSVILNSASQIALTKLDAVFPDCSKAREFSNLPQEARRFVETIESRLKTPVTLIGTGPDANDIIDRASNS